MAAIGSYVLHLYCDEVTDSPAHRDYYLGRGFGEFTGDNLIEAMGNARKSGWRIKTPRGSGRLVSRIVATCPECQNP